MNEALLDPLRHHSWAIQELLAFCDGLSEDQLATTVEGTYGGIRATFHHVLESDAYYVGLLSGTAPAWYREEDDKPPPSMDELATRAEEIEERWERVLADAPFEPGRRILDGDYAIEAGVLLTQVLDHGTEHRSQIATILTQLGRPPPELDGWAYGEAHGRAGEV